MSFTKPDRRALLAGTAALTLSSLVAPTIAAAQEDANLRLFWWGSTPRAERTYAVADQYMAENPNVTIEGETVGWADYWTRLATQVAGRNAPDVIQMDYRYIFEYARRGALADLSEYRDGALPLEGFEEASLQGGMVDDGLYGVSLGANSSASMIDADAFEAAGLEVPTGAMTYDAMADAVMQVVEATDYDYGMHDASGHEPQLENWLRQRGTPLYTDDGALGFTVEDATEWFEMWADLRERGVTVPPDQQALYQRSIETSAVTLGQAPVSFAHSNQLTGYRELNDSTITMIPLPLIEEGATGGHYRKPSQLFSVSSSAENPEAAAAFIDYFVTNPEAVEILEVERGVPESTVAREELAPKLNEADQAQLEYIENLGDLAGPLPPPPPAGAGEVEALLIRVSEQVAFGQQTPAEGAEQLVSEAQSILSR